MATLMDEEKGKVSFMVSFHYYQLGRSLSLQEAQICRQRVSLGLLRFTVPRQA